MICSGECKQHLYRKEVFDPEIHENVDSGEGI